MTGMSLAQGLVILNLRGISENARPRMNLKRGKVETSKNGMRGVVKTNTRDFLFDSGVH